MFDWMNNSQLLKPEAKAHDRKLGLLRPSHWILVECTRTWWFRGMLTRDDGKGAYPLFSFKKTCLPLMKQIWLIYIYIWLIIHSIDFHYMKLPNWCRTFFHRQVSSMLGLFCHVFPVLLLIDTRLRLLLLLILLLPRNNVFFKGDTKARSETLDPWCHIHWLKFITSSFFKMCGSAYVLDAPLFRLNNAFLQECSCDWIVREGYWCHWGWRTWGPKPHPGSVSKWAFLPVIHGGYFTS